MDVLALHARRAERRGLLRAFAVFGVFWGAWSAVLPAVQQGVGLGDGQLGLALGAIAVSAVPMMPLAGRLVDRFGARRTLPATLVAFAAVLPLLATAGGAGSLVAWLVLLGAATGALDVVVNATTAGWERVERSRLMSLVHGAFSVGVLVGSACAGLARQAGAGPLPVVVTVAALVLLVGVTQPPYRRATPDPQPSDRHRRLPALLVGIGLLTAGAFFVEDALQSWSALHLERGLGASPALSGLGPGLYAAAMAAGRLSGGALARFRDGPVLSAFALLLTGGIALTALAPSPAVALAGLALAGAGTSVLAPVLYSAVGSRAPAGREGADLATVTALGYVGFVAGPPSVGAVSAATSLPVAIGALGVVALLLAALGPVVLRRSRTAPVPVAGSRDVAPGR